MRVGQRLFLAVIPAVLGVLAMAGLAYWGERGRQIPELLLVAGVLAATVSLAMAWHNTRYVARRIDALSRRHASATAAESGEDGAADELDAIERTIGEAERRGETREQAAEALVREYAGLLADAAAMVGGKLDEVRLPLHILLSSPFGELNENQEEMIGAARAAADDADEALRFIDRVVELDAGRVTPRPERIRPRDLLAPVLAAVAPRLERAGAALETELPPLLPHLRVDPRLTREALSLVLDRLAARAKAGTRLRLAVEERPGGLLIRIADASLHPGERFPLAERLLRLQGGELRTATDAVEILLPLAVGGG